MQEVIIADKAFDVSGNNYEEFDQELDPEKLGDKLIQTNPLKGSVREYQFYTSRHLLLNFIEKKHSKEKNFASILPIYLLSQNIIKSSYGSGYTML